MRITINNPDPVVEFMEMVGMSPYDNDARQVRVRGLTAYNQGTMCDTCPFLYEQVESVTPSLSGIDISNMLRSGLSDISKELVDSISTLVPSGDYAVAKLTTLPKFIEIKKWARSAKRDARFGYPVGYGYIENDFFIGRKFQVDPFGYVEESILPLYSINHLNQKTTDYYKNQLEMGKKPVALALTIVDGKHSMSGSGYSAPDVFNIMHFLLDGHHKVMAACEARIEIDILSFFRITGSGGTTTHTHTPPMMDLILASLY
jgi:hypothetical protein